MSSSDTQQGWEQVAAEAETRAVGHRMFQTYRGTSKLVDVCWECGESWPCFAVRLTACLSSTAAEGRAAGAQVNQTDNLLAEADALCSAATPGPWEAGGNIECHDEGQNCWHAFDVEAQIFPPLGQSGPVAIASQGESDFNNAAFIARARSLVPELAALVRQQAAEVARLREALGQIARQTYSGPLSSRELTHAANCIADMREIATAALATGEAEG